MSESDSRIEQTIRSKSGNVIGRKFRHLTSSNIMTKLGQKIKDGGNQLRDQFEEDVEQYKDKFHNLKIKQKNKVKYFYAN